MIGKLLCALPKWLGGGHKRGVFVSEAAADGGNKLKTFQCPRCKRTTRYVTKPAKLQAVA